MNFKRAGIYIRILIPALMLYALGSLFITGGKLERARELLLQAQETVQALERQNAELEADIACADDPEMLERLARQRLGLVMPGDKVFYDGEN